MANYSMKCVVSLMVWALATPLLPLAWATGDVNAIRFGEPALAFSSGSIQLSTPQDGFVNVITGDNQTTGDRMILGSQDVLYLRLKSPVDVAPGDLFTIYKRAYKVFHPTTGQYLGYLVNRLAVVQVSHIDKDLTTVQIVRSYAAVSPGDPVMKFVPPTDEGAAIDRPSAGDVEGRVVEFQSHMGIMNMVAQRDIVYLDRGREDGIRPGDRMDIVRSGGSLPQRVVGELKILSLEDRTATALITKSISRILKGDRFMVKTHAPEAIPISQSPLQSPGDSPAVEASPAVTPSPSTFQAKNVAGETRISLSDLMKQLRYESGEATITPEGYQVLDGLIAHLKTTAGDRLIRVEGHADNMEIGPSLKSIYQTNWDLSKARAVGVLRYLIEKGGIDSAKLSSVGYGDTKPIAGNATEVGRQKNRRVDIVLYSPESASEQSEQAAKPTEANASKYSMSSLSSAESGVPIPTVDQPIPAAPTGSSKVEPSSISADPASVTTPASVGQSNSDPKPTAPIAPPQ
ncbi:MAG TPA: OmpA family protein [Nitrospiraceae bacterium]|nr:OmpA family protein [Nitrospiraceae bacterium]